MKYRYQLYQDNTDFPAIISKEVYSSVESAALAGFNYALAHPQDYVELTVDKGCLTYLHLELTSLRKGCWYE